MQVSMSNINHLLAGRKSARIKQDKIENKMTMKLKYKIRFLLIYHVYFLIYLTAVAKIKTVTTKFIKNRYWRLLTLLLTISKSFLKLVSIVLNWSHYIQLWPRFSFHNFLLKRIQKRVLIISLSHSSAEHRPTTEIN